MKKLLFVFMFLLLVGFANAKEVSNNIQLSLVGDNLTISSTSNSWSFNISGGDLTSTMNNTFDVQFIGDGNLSYFLNDIANDIKYWKEIRDVNIELHSNITGLLVDKESCDPDKNPKCSEQKSLLDNQTTIFDTCKTDLATKTVEKTNCNTQLTTVKEDKEKMLPQLWVLGAALAGFGIAWSIWGRNPVAKHPDADINRTMPDNSQGTNLSKLKSALDSYKNRGQK